MDSLLTNQPESKSFLSTALTWHGSVTPFVITRVAVTFIYALLVLNITEYFPHFSFPITPFEYSGAVLALLMVLRVNAGNDRWWEARKIWGSIVNQSRNLAVVVNAYSKKNVPLSQQTLAWIACWPYVIKESLRKEKKLEEVIALIGQDEAEMIRQADHMPTYVGIRIARLLLELKNHGFDSIAFLRAETERSLLLDAVGACERIKNTRMPFALAIKTRRFIFLFVLLLPFALMDRLGWLTPFVVMLASYPLFSLDEIGSELQNPFSPRNLSHLPLNEICKTIERNILEINRKTE